MGLGAIGVGDALLELPGLLQLGFALDDLGLGRLNLGVERLALDLEVLDRGPQRLELLLVGVKRFELRLGLLKVEGRAPLRLLELSYLLLGQEQIGLLLLQVSGLRPRFVQLELGFADVAHFLLPFGMGVLGRRRVLLLDRLDAGARV